MAVAGAIGLACAESAPIATAPDPPTTGTPATAQGCARTSVGLTPLSDLVGPYQGEPGGLYPGGRNEPPPDHLASGLAIGRAIGPLDAAGQPNASGRYVFVSIGMSNTTQEFSRFVQLAAADPTRDPRLAIVDGAQGGVTAVEWRNPGCPCWNTLNSRLAQAGLSAQQVVAAWVKLADAQPSSGWPAYARTLQGETEAVLRLLRARFPNLRLAYLSSRIYAGYATSTLNPEPYAYESAFAVRWAIENQLRGALPFEGAAADAPWLAWGPYLWADGLRPRSDGLTWACDELQSDGTHPSTSGREKVAARMLSFVKTDPTAREWFVGP
jgi:hypothetical protein